MFAKRILTQSVVYWTFLLAVLTTLTAFSLTQDAPESSSLIALDPSEMAGIIGGGPCNECEREEGDDVECEGGPIWCAPGAECANFGHCVEAGANPPSDHIYCYYPEWKCTGDRIPDGALQCNQWSGGVSVRIYNCDCINGKCTTRTSILAGYVCNQNGPDICPC